MSKKLKSLITVCLVLCLSVFIGVFAAACDDPKSDYLTITIKLDDNTPAEGVEANLCTLNGSLVTCFDTAPEVSDKNGVLKFNLKDVGGLGAFDVSDTTQFQIKLHNLPTGYIYADDSGNAYAEGDGRIFDTTVTGYSVTITLTAKA